MDKNNDEIERLLEEYKEQKRIKEISADEMPEPPVKRSQIIDFAKEEEETSESTKQDKNKPDLKLKLKALLKSSKQKLKECSAKLKKTPEQKAKTKENIKKSALAVKNIITNKRFFVPLISAALAIALALSVSFLATSAKEAYLKPYKDKYPDVDFPVGILEKYCDDYGQNPSMQAYVKTGAVDKGFALGKKELEPIEKNANRFNYVVYLDTDELEEKFSTADGYNNSDKEIIYSDLFSEYTFEVIGSFYTNTKAEDDNGYIFPYNVTERMTRKSFDSYIDRIDSRLRYNVSGGSIEREDTLLTISCPTKYREGYRFVVICRQTDKVNNKLVATEKDKIHLTQAEYTELGKDNPYRFAGKWYPEIIINSGTEDEATIQKSIDDYKQ